MLRNSCLSVALPAFLAAVVFGGAARAEVMTFEGLPGGSLAVSSYTEDGITATKTIGNFYVFDTSVNKSLAVVSPVDFTFAGGLFDLVSLDYLSITFGVTGGRDSFASFFVIGYDASNAEVGGANINTFSQGTAVFSASNKLTNLSRVSVSGAIGAATIDNFTIRSRAVAAVPEPSAWALMICGFAAVGCAARRRRGFPVYLPVQR